MREKMARFMYGRNGMDALAKFESWVVIIILFISIFVGFLPVYLLALAGMIHMYYRVFSRNVYKRQQENQKFLNLKYKVVVRFNKWKARRRDSKYYRFYKCPDCKQRVRVPKGHGRIEIACPRCRAKFIRKS